MDPAWLCGSSGHLELDETNKVQARMPNYNLNWTVRSSAIRGWQKCHWCSSSTRRWPSRSREPFGPKSSMEHWPSGTDARQSYISHCLPPDRNWHKINDPKVDYSEERKVELKPRLEPCWTILVIDPYSAIYAWWVLLDLDPNLGPGTYAWL